MVNFKVLKVSQLHCPRFSFITFDRLLKFAYHFCEFFPKIYLKKVARTIFSHNCVDKVVPDWKLLGLGERDFSIENE